ncbi:hypothetical protein D9758_009776 [Tetrapyrgos nigripes]|uniref:Uncharacterized protein n=1 Tax=Tetrapyrgos nigripes TaxID=182062 RepID=A0A8H5GK60_9AGAR|nr:hypothetical protein D9758_009776 [Tetrapyrgos nigripes]
MQSSSSPPRVAVLLLCCCFLIACAAPLDHNRRGEDDTTPASDSDAKRSIQDIVWSCLATIFACAWTSIHPNIPPINEGRVKSFLRRTGITVLALIAPELIVIWALRQWLVSRQIAREYRGLGWEQVHGFFAIMGGFMLYDEQGNARHVVYPRRLSMFLDSPELRITAEEIWDKSKGDVLAKGFVILQTTWFILQCIARVSQGSTITQLEALTLAFAALNVVIYGLWWNKPQGVERPVRVARTDSDECFLRLNAMGIKERDTPVIVWRRWSGLSAILRILFGSDDDHFLEREDVAPNFESDFRVCWNASAIVESPSGIQVSHGHYPAMRGVSRHFIQDGKKEDPKSTGTLRVTVI